MSNLIFLQNTSDIVVPATTALDHDCSCGSRPYTVQPGSSRGGGIAAKKRVRGEGVVQLYPNHTNVVVQRIKGLAPVGPTISHLQGWDDTNGEFVFPVDGTYKASMSLGYNEPEDNGSQATAACILYMDKSTNWIRHDRQLPEGFFHSFGSGDVTGNPDKGEKLYIDFTNATGKEITITSVVLRVELLKEQAH
jgi:hypothetical protein